MTGLDNAEIENDEPSESCRECRRVVVGDRLHVEAELPVTAVTEGEHLALIAHHGSVILAAAHLKMFIQRYSEKIKVRV